MLKNELIAAVAEKSSQPKTAVDVTIRALGEVLREYLSEPGKKVKVHGVGTFEVKVQAARTARNPMTGAPIQVAEKTVIKVKSDV